MYLAWHQSSNKRVGLPYTILDNRHRGLCTNVQIVAKTNPCVTAVIHFDDFGGSERKMPGVNTANSATINKKKITFIL